MFKVPERFRMTHARDPKYNSDASYGNNGRFSIKSKYGKNRILYLIQASDGEGWEHVSVSLPLNKRCPTWEEMCFIKDMFWSPEDVVIQYHPAKKDYVSHVSNCLHLWKPTGQDIPTPNSMFIGPNSAKK